VSEADPSRDESFERVEARRLGLSTGSKWLLGSAIAFPLLTGLLGAIAGEGSVAAPLAMIAYLLALLVSVGVGTKKGWFGLAAQDGLVEVSSAGVRIDGKLVADRRKVDNAAVVRDERLGGARVLLGKKGSPRRSLALLAASDEEAHAIVKKLGLDANASTSTWTTLGGFGYATWGLWAQLSPLLLAFPLIFMAAAMQSVIPVVPAALCFVAFYALLFSKTHVVVGADGVLVKWLTMQRFCSLSDVASVERLTNGVRLVQRDGAHFDIKLATEQQVRNDRLAVVTPEIEALYTRVREAMNARGAARDAMIASDPFLRNDRSARAWLDGLRKLFEPVGGLRSSAHTEESAWRVVSDSAAEEEARIGAAAALANNSDERSKERLRAVAANVASTRVRVAIEAAAKGDEEALVESMEALAKEGAERATKK
jgi:hypothetical protein